MNINQMCMKCMMGKINEDGICTSCGALQDAEKNGSIHLPIRTILRGKYLVGKVIGEGGFGITYIGYDLDLEICVAIKEFCPKAYTSRDVEDGITLYLCDESKEEVFAAERDKFINEARRLAKFRNEGGVVSVLDYFMENGTAYIVMDYIDGITLKSYLKTLRNTTAKSMNMAGVLKLFKPIMDIRLMYFVSVQLSVISFYLLYIMCSQHHFQFSWLKLVLGITWVVKLYSTK